MFSYLTWGCFSVTEGFCANISLQDSFGFVFAFFFNAFFSPFLSFSVALGSGCDKNDSMKHSRKLQILLFCRQQTNCWITTILHRKLSCSALRSSHSCLCMFGVYKLSTMPLTFQLVPLACLDADGFEVSRRITSPTGTVWGFLGVTNLWSAKQSTGQLYLQPSKKEHWQRNKQWRGGAFHHFTVILPLLELAAQARQCHLAPFFDMPHSLDTRQKGCHSLKTCMSLPFLTVILLSILPYVFPFLKPTPLAQVRLHPCHNLALLPVFFPSPFQHILSIKST